MYFAVVALFIFALPIGSVALEHFLVGSKLGLLQLTGIWFCFWSVGVRLFLAGLRQAIQPSFTAHKIFELSGDEAFVVIQELGFANISLGLIGMGVLLRPSWVLPAALAGGLFYGLAGIRHLFNSRRNTLENVATFSDLFAASVLLGCFIGQIRG